LNIKISNFNNYWGHYFVVSFCFISSSKAKKNERQAIYNLFEKEITLNIQEFKDQGTEHISEPGQFTYNSNPPTSGPYYGQAPSWDFLQSLLMMNQLFMQ
jgi:hypothetical protein